MVVIPVRALQVLCPSTAIPSDSGDTTAMKKVSGYATNKYKQEAKAAGKDTLGDDFIISKISDGQFNS